jgi:hypothetical protein
MRGLVGGYGIGSRPLGRVKCRGVRRRRRHVVTCELSRLEARAVRLGGQPADHDVLTEHYPAWRFGP